MESTHFSSNAENRPFGALRARFSSWPVLAQIQRIGQSELQKQDFRAGPGHMKSTRLGTNVKDRQNAENRPSELRKRDFRAGAPTARFSSWPRKRPFFARVHMKSSHFSSTQRIGDSELRKGDFRKRPFFARAQYEIDTFRLKCRESHGPCSSS